MVPNLIYTLKINAFGTLWIGSYRVNGEIGIKLSPLNIISDVKETLGYEISNQCTLNNVQ